MLVNVLALAVENGGQFGRCWSKQNGSSHAKQELGQRSLDGMVGWMPYISSSEGILEMLRHCR